MLHQIPLVGIIRGIYMLQFSEEPKVIAQYLNGKFKYNVTVPLIGEPLVPEEWDGYTLQEVLFIIGKREADFNAQEKANKYGPNVRINVGYWVQPSTITSPPSNRDPGTPANPIDGTTISNPEAGKIITYYQVKTDG